MSGRRRPSGALLALARVHRAITARRLRDPLPGLDAALGLVEAELRRLAPSAVRDRSAEELVLEVLAPPQKARKRTRVDGAILGVLEDRTGFGGPDVALGLTTEALAALVRARGVRVVLETVRRRALALAREGAVSASKRVFKVRQPSREDAADSFGPGELFGGQGRCVRRQWRFAVPSSAHPAGVHGGRSR